MALDAVIFDLGNVFAFHDNELLFERLGEAYGADREGIRRCLEPLFEEINRGRIDGAALHRRLGEHFMRVVPFHRFEALWSSHFTLNEEAVELARSLEGRLRRVLLSNTNALHWAFLRPRLPVLERFDGLVLSHEVGLVKPEREIYEAALRLSGARSGRAIFFDDIPEYVTAAREAGLLAEVFTTASAARETLDRLLER